MQRLLLRLIGVFEIAGGLFGLVAQIERLFPWGSMPDMISALVGIVLFALLLVAGVLLLEHHAAGTRLSRWLQLAQLPVIGTSFFSYALYAGVRLDLDVVIQRPLSLLIHADIGRWHWLLALAGPHNWHLGINLVALAALGILRWKRA
ncbi:hypothetical protein [Oleiagrimonas sp.]|jgi:hypothetical protein|uniref:hypothetical protein n=1 Tax=Oleiagrimonas sp. TaxID=2010330 RepID=UPI002623A085|nr:hypothetical protein [Oleiagrimonas sp.]MDA3913350.1 hypothetical protein [Oleiagrimonas sp.]